MKLAYEAPQLFCDEYVADTMIASGLAVNPKNGNAGNNQNCWGCDLSKGAPDGYGDVCLYYPNANDWYDGNGNPIGSFYDLFC